jgi:hypothetical protein
MALVTAIFFRNRLEKMNDKFGFNELAGNHRYVREKEYDVSE